MDNGARGMECSSCEGRGDSKHSGIFLVEISKIFVMQNNVFHGVMPFDTVEDTYTELPTWSIRGAGRIETDSAAGCTSARPAAKSIKVRPARRIDHKGGSVFII